MGIDLLPAIRLGRIESSETYRPSEPATDTHGDVCEERSSLGALVGRVHPGIEANGRRSFQNPRNPTGHKMTTTTRKAHTRPLR